MKSFILSSDKILYARKSLQIETQYKALLHWVFTMLISTYLTTALCTCSSRTTSISKHRYDLTSVLALYCFEVLHRITVKMEDSPLFKKIYSFHLVLFSYHLVNAFYIFRSPTLQSLFYTNHVLPKTTRVPWVKKKQIKKHGKYTKHCFSFSIVPKQITN